MTARLEDAVFLIDVDGTLFDSAAMKRAFGAVVDRLAAGGPGQARFWDTYDAVRSSAGVVDWMETVDRFAIESGTPALAGPLKQELWDLPFASYLYPRALETLGVLARLGRTVILSDGRGPFQQLKIERAGIAAAVGGRVLVYERKAERAGDIMARFPAPHYVIVDNLQPVLDRLGAELVPSTSTVLVADHLQRVHPPAHPGRADFEISMFADLLNLSLSGRRRMFRSRARWWAGPANVERGMPGCTRCQCAVRRLPP